MSQAFNFDSDGSPRMVRVAISLLWTQLLGSGIRVLYLILIARILAPADVGIYMFGIAFSLTLLGLLSFGQNILLATRAGRKQQGLAVIASHSFTVISLLAAFVFVGGLVFIFFGFIDRPSERPAIVLFLLTAVARGFVSWMRNYFIALEDSSWIPRYELSFRGAEAVAGSIVLLMGGGLIAICSLHLIAWLTEAAATWGKFRAKTQNVFVLGSDRRLLSRLVKLSAVYALGFWLIQSFPQLGVLTLRFVQPDASIVAQFGIGMQLIAVLSIVPLSFSQAILPGISRARRLNSSADIATIATVIKLALLGGATIAVLLDSVAPPIITLVFGDSFALSGNAFVSLSWAFGPYAAVLISLQALNALGMRNRATMMAAVMVVVFFLAFGLISLEPMQATIAAFVIASGFGAIMGAVTLTGRVGAPWWWIPTVALALVHSAVFVYFDANQIWLPLLVIASLGLFSGLLRVFSRAEFATITRKFHSNRNQKKIGS